MTKEKKKNHKHDFISKAELYDYLISHYVNLEESLSSEDIYQLNLIISLPKSELTDIIKKDLIKERNKKWK